MKCEYGYCIYNEESICRLSKIHIDSLGMCEECIEVSIPDTVLKPLKEEQINEME